MKYKFKIGDRVMWSGGFGADPPKPATIEGLGSKNGYPVYDLDTGHWAYEDQLREIK